MGNITLCDYFGSTDLDNWDIVSLKAFDKPAAQLNFIDVRHAYCLVSLRNPKPIQKGCCRSLADCWMGCCLTRCLGNIFRCLTCTCCCGSCCIQTTELEQALYSQSTMVIIELTGSATKGAFLRQSFYQFEDEVSEKNSSSRLWKESQIMDIQLCRPKDQLILCHAYSGSHKFGELRRQLIMQFQNTKYSIRDNNCFHFVCSVFKQLGIQADIIQRRQKVIEANVRQHDMLVPTLEKVVA